MLNINSIALGIVIGLASFGMIIGSANATVMVDFEPSNFTGFIVDVARELLVDISEICSILARSDYHHLKYFFLD